MSIQPKKKSEESEVAKPSAGSTYKWAEQRERENQIVEGTFQCHEPRGGMVSFFFKKFRGDPVRQYTMWDGQKYKIPIAVANHINNNCNYPVYQETLGNDGLREISVGKRVQRFNFVRLFEDGL